MNRILLICAGLLLCSAALAEEVLGRDRVLCSVSVAMICLELGQCHNVHPAEIGMPSFVVLDTRKGTLSTTPSSGEVRTTTAINYQREDGRIFFQGLENGRAFSVMIEEDIGAMSAAIARDGVTVSAFGECTDARID